METSLYPFLFGTLCLSGLFTSRFNNDLFPCTLFSCNNISYQVGLFSQRCELVNNVVYVFTSNDGQHANAHVEGSVHFVKVDVPFALEKFKNGKHRPGAFCDMRIAPGRKYSWDVVYKATASVMNQAVYWVTPQEVSEAVDIDTGRAK